MKDCLRPPNGDGPASSTGERGTSTRAGAAGEDVTGVRQLAGSESMMADGIFACRKPHAGASSGHGLATRDVRAGIMMHTLVCLLAASEYVQSMSCPNHALGGYKLDPAWRMGCRGRQHTGCM